MRVTGHFNDARSSECVIIPDNATHETDPVVEDTVLPQELRGRQLRDPRIRRGLPVQLSHSPETDEGAAHEGRLLRIGRAGGEAALRDLRLARLSGAVHRGDRIRAMPTEGVRRHAAWNCCAASAGSMEREFMRRTLLALVSAAMLAIALVGAGHGHHRQLRRGLRPPVRRASSPSTRIARERMTGSSTAAPGSLVDDGTPADGSRVVVTAGHCTDDGTGDAVAVSARIWFRQDAGTRYDGTRDPLTGYPDKCIDDPAVRARRVRDVARDVQLRLRQLRRLPEQPRRRRRHPRQAGHPAGVRDDHRRRRDHRATRASSSRCRATASPTAMRPATRRSRSASG